MAVFILVTTEDERIEQCKINFLPFAAGSNGSVKFGQVDSPASRKSDDTSPDRGVMFRSDLEPLQ